MERGAFFDNVVAEDHEEDGKFEAEGLNEQLRSLGSFIQDENCAEGAKENESLRGSHGAERQEHKESAEEDGEVGVGEAIIQQEQIL